MVLGVVLADSLEAGGETQSITFSCLCFCKHPDVKKLKWGLGDMAESLITDLILIITGRTVVADRVRLFYHQ